MSPWRRATHFSILAWRMLWTEELGGLQSIGSQRVRHDCSDLVCAYMLMIYVECEYDKE